MTDRDRLLAALFALREAQPARGDHEAQQQPGAAPTESDAESILQLLISHGAGLRRHRHRAYGMPSWAAAAVDRLIDDTKDRLIDDTKLKKSPWCAALRTAIAQQWIDDPREPHTELEELLEVLLDPQSAPSNVVSVFAPARRRAMAASTSATGDVLDAPTDPEALWRARRMDVVLAHRDIEAGIVIGLELVEDHGGDPARPSWVDDGFHEGILNGQHAAVALLERIGDVAAAEDARLRRRISDPRLLGPARLQGASVGLAAALQILRTSCARSVDLGPPAVVASGVFGPDGLLESMSEEIARPKAAAVAADGTHRRLAAPARCAGVVAVGNLEEAANAAWPGDWERYARECVTARLKRRRMRGGIGRSCPWSPFPAEPDRAVVRPRAADEIIAELCVPASSRSTVINLSGPPRSGKTTIAQIVADELADRDWSIAWLAASEPFIDGDPDEFTETAGWLVPSGRTRPVLLVVDDLTSVVSADLDELAMKLDGKADAVLLVATIGARDSDRRFRADRVRQVRSPSSTSDMREVARAMIHAEPELEPARGSVDAVIGASNHDLGLLHQLLVWAAQTSPLRYEHVPERWKDEVLAHLDPEELEAARRLAAGSLIGLEVSERLLRPLTPRRLTWIGAQRGRDGWSLTSPFLARRTIRQQPDGSVAPKGRVGGLVGALAPRADLDERRVRLAADAAPRVAPEVAGWLADVLRRGEDWSNWSHPTTFAVVLDRLGGRYFKAPEAEAIAATLIDKLVGRMDELSPFQLAACLRQVRRFADDPTTLRDPLHAYLDHIAERESGPAARHSLLRAIVDLRIADEHALIMDHLPAFFAGMSPGDEDDRATAARMVRVLLRHSGYDAPATERDHLMPQHRPDPKGIPATRIGEGILLIGDAERALLQQDPAVLPFLEAPGPHAELTGWAAWLDLSTTLRYGPAADARSGWDGLVDIARDHVAEAVRRSQPMSCVSALQELHKAHPGLAVRLIHRSELLAPLRAMLDRSLSLGQRSAVLTLLWHVHSHTAYEALLVDNPRDRSLRPLVRPEALEACKRDAEARVDPRGLGMLLRIAHEVDDTYGDPANGFANELGKAVGWKALEHSLELDDRVEVTAHLVRALSDAHVDFLLRRAVDSTVERTTRLLTQGQPNALEIARALAGTPIAGQLLPRLAAELRIDDTRASQPRDGLLKLATDNQHIRSVPAAHAVIAALDPAGLPLSNRVQEQFTAGAITFSAPQPHVVASALSALAGTLARSGHADARRSALRATPSAWDWTASIEQLRRPEWAVETLDHLRALSPGLAREVCAELAPSSGATSRLMDWLVAAVRQNTHVAVQLLSTIHAIDAEEIGPLVWSALQDRKAWRRLRDDVFYLQDPRSQAVAAQGLLACGWEPPDHEMKRLWEDRWSRVLQSVRSPAALGEVLRMLHALPDADGRAVAAARTISVAGVARRLRAGSSADLGWVPMLLGTLRDLDEEVTARGIAAGLQPDHVAGRAPLDQVAAIVGVLESIGLYELAAEIRSRLADRVAREATRAGVRDPAAHWLALGDVAGCIEGRELTPIEDQPRTLHDADAVAALWGTVHLPPADWIEELVPRALAGVLHSRDDLSVPQLARLLAASLYHGVADAVMAAPLEWDRLHRAPASEHVLLERAIRQFPESAQAVRSVVRGP